MNNILEHAGIKGMKWGRRRNKLSPSSDRNISEALKKKNVKELSNAEIDSVIKRLNLEKQFKASTTKSGRKFVNDILLISGKTVLTAAVSAGMIQVGKKVLANVLKLKE